MRVQWSGVGDVSDVFQLQSVRIHIISCSENRNQEVETRTAYRTGSVFRKLIVKLRLFREGGAAVVTEWAC